MEIFYCILDNGEKIGIVNYQVYGRAIKGLDYINEFEVGNKYTRVDKEFIEQNQKLYKSVLFKDNKLVSDYDNNFIYKVGEYAIAENIDETHGGIYAGIKEYVLGACYYKRGKSVLLEVKYDLDNLKFIDAEGNVRFKKVFIKSIEKEMN